MKANFTVETAKIVGTPNGGYWSQTHSFSPEDLQKKEKRGTLLAILVIRNLTEGIKAVAVGREILSRLHEEYYGNLEGSAFERLGDAVRKICREEERLEITAAALLGSVLYLASFGSGRTILIRNGKFGEILSFQEGLQTASGFIKDGDLLIIGSGKFFRSAGEEILRTAVENKNPNEAVELLAPTILGRSDMADAAAIMVVFKKESEEEIIGVEKEKEATVYSEPTPKITVNWEGGEKHRKIYFLVSIILLVLLLSGLVFGLKRRNEKKTEMKVRTFIGQAEEKYNQSRILFGTQPKEGRELAKEAQKTVQSALEIDKKNQEAQTVKKQIEDFLSSSAQEVAVENTAVFMDLSLIADNSSGDAFSLNGKTLSIFDQAKKKIYLLDVEKKSNSVSDFSTDEIKYVTSAAARGYIFNSSGIFEIKNSAKSSDLAIKTDEEWKNITGFGSFNGNLYLLDKGAGNIWRYLKTDTGFKPKSSYFIGTPPDLSTSVSIAIDGSLWILTDRGISKYTLGKEDSFSISKMPETFSNPVKIYTSEIEQNLYVLDKEANKIFVIGKDGSFKTSYVWEGIKGVTDLVSIESMKKILLLSGSKIFEIQIK